ncbi:hypothetical protein [uncultured Chryseobacterium sp.]|uniref:hypothetical protein n=1 Tax=uncultured Chryseobacterium sp. TaxID=259322 RepID=UPI0025EFE818|nr:hypothetical protein [uncultured Chryseobacterium sp.]
MQVIQYLHGSSPNRLFETGVQKMPGTGNTGSGIAWRSSGSRLLWLHFGNAA